MLGDLCALCGSSGAIEFERAIAICHWPLALSTAMFDIRLAGLGRFHSGSALPTSAWFLQSRRNDSFDMRARKIRKVINAETSTP
jgi:hypothetical protein